MFQFKSCYEVTLFDIHKKAEVSVLVLIVSYLVLLLSMFPFSCWDINCME